MNSASSYSKQKGTHAAASGHRNGLCWLRADAGHRELPRYSPAEALKGCFSFFSLPDLCYSNQAHTAYTDCYV